MAPLDPPTISKLWDEMEEDIECIPDKVKEHPELLTSQNSEGQTLTEFLCGHEDDASPITRDTLDELIGAGAAVTDQCYRNVFSADSFSNDMIESLIQSGYFPVELEVGRQTKKKTLDLIFEAVQDEIDEPEDIVFRLEGTFKLLFDRDNCSEKFKKQLQKLPQVVIGTSFAKDGKFAGFVGDEENREEYEILQLIYDKSGMADDDVDEEVAGKNNSSPKSAAADIVGPSVDKKTSDEKANGKVEKGRSPAKKARVV